MEDNKIKERIDRILPYLNEKQTRLYLAAEAQIYGWGGKSKIAKLAKVSRMLISRGEKEQESSDCQTDKKRIRRCGAGRHKETDKQSGLVSNILQIVECHTVGNPMKPLLWTSKSVRKIQVALKEREYSVSHELIRQILIEQGYSLQANRKTKEGGKPLTSLAVIINLINETTTKTGLTVKAKLDEKNYPTGIKISDENFEKINIKRNNFHSEWNYIIYPN
jgi:hypothetical protein